jgi:hypothetical protein
MDFYEEPGGLPVGFTKEIRCFCCWSGAPGPARPEGPPLAEVQMKRLNGIAMLTDSRAAPLRCRRICFRRFG